MIKEKVASLNLCNPTSNKYLPKCYDIIHYETNIILKFNLKIDLLYANSYIQYDESTKCFL